MQRGVGLLAVVVAVAGCGLLPRNYGDPSPECVGVFAEGVQLEWAGPFSPRTAAGLFIETGDADIYVGPAGPDNLSLGPGERAFCAVYRDGGVVSGPVPEWWEPP